MPEKIEHHYYHHPFNYMHNEVVITALVVELTTARIQTNCSITVRCSTIAMAAHPLLVVSEWSLANTDTINISCTMNSERGYEVILCTIFLLEVLLVYLVE